MATCGNGAWTGTSHRLVRRRRLIRRVPVGFGACLAWRQLVLRRPELPVRVPQLRQPVGRRLRQQPRLPPLLPCGAVSSAFLKQERKQVGKKTSAETNTRASREAERTAAWRVRNKASGAEGKRQEANGARQYILHAARGCWRTARGVERLLARASRHERGEGCASRRVGVLRREDGRDGRRCGSGVAQ